VVLAELPRVTLVGLKEQVRPGGEEYEKVTVPTNPARLWTWTWNVPVPPGAIATLDGLAVIENVLTAIVSVTRLVCVPDFPVTVTV
jgi:hypothetical protein